MFKMIGMGDLHFPCKDKSGEILEDKNRFIRDEFYQYYLDGLFEKEADVYFSVGDITTSGDKREFDELYRNIRRYNKNFYQVLGNHDLLQHTRNEIYSQINMKYNTFFEYDDVFLVFLETGREMDRENFGGWVSEEQKDWLKELITLSNSKTMVIIAHHPVYQTTKNTVKNMHNVDPQTELWSVLEEKKDGKGIYINGHIHEDSIAKRDNWHFIQFCAVLDDPAIRIFEIHQNQFSYRTEKLTDEGMLEKAKLIGEINEQFNLQDDGPGTDAERNLVLEVSTSLQ